jgi:hypothetical protein
MTSGNHIDKFFRRKLYNYESTVSDDLWSNLEKKRNKAGNGGWWKNYSLNILLLLLLGSASTYVYVNTFNAGEDTAEVAPDLIAVNGYTSMPGKQKIDKQQNSIVTEKVEEVSTSVTQINPVVFNEIKKSNTKISGSAGNELTVSRNMNPAELILPKHLQFIETEEVESGTSISPIPGAYSPFSVAFPVSGKFSAEILFAPESYFSRMGNLSSAHPDFVTSHSAAESIEPAYSKGVKVSYNLTSNISVKSGFVHSGKKSSFTFLQKDIVEKQMVDSVIGWVMDPTNNPVRVVYYNHYSVTQEETSLFNDENKYSYYTIPVSLSYKIFGKNKFNIKSTGGFSYSFNNSSGTTISPENGKAVNMQDVLRSSGIFTLSGSLSLEYVLNSNTSFVVEPYYNHGINSVFIDQLSTKRFNSAAGIYTGIRYNF